MNEKQRQTEFLELFEPVRENLSRFARAMVREREEAKDLVSEAIMLGFENFNKLKDRTAFLSYMFTIIHRLYKRNKRHRSYFTEFDSKFAEQIKANDTSPETIIDVKLLYLALDELPFKQKEAVILFEISGFSIEEIKKIQGGTISGVKSRLKRGREKLGEIMNFGNVPDLHPKNGTNAKPNKSYIKVDLLNIKEHTILN